MKTNKVINAQEAVELIQDGQTIGIAVSGHAGMPEELFEAISERFLKTGHPKNITVTHGAGSGDFQDNGGTATISHDGLIKKIITAYIGASPKTAKMAAEDKIECYFFPQGVVTQLFGEIARKSPGLISRVGLGTFVDPRIEGGKVNNVSKEDLVKLIDIEGEEYLFFKSFPIHFALLRGTTADTNGNMSIEKEGKIMESLPLAQAAKASGGKVIIQVETLVEPGTLHPASVVVPGIYVDHIVVAQKPQRQTMGTLFNRSFSGEVKIPASNVNPLPLNADKIICRRAAMEVLPGPVNFGIGIPQGIGNVLSEEGVADLVTTVSEIGNIGGIPGVGLDFGHHYNAEARIPHHSSHIWFDGGSLKQAFFGLAQTDKEGNVNAAKFSGKMVGPGGFINVTAGCQEPIFCGTLTARGLEAKIEGGKIAIAKEGTEKKFLDQVEQISFSGKQARKDGKHCLYITERCVFELRDEGMTIIEIAPGIDLEKDILAQMNFKPVISPDLKLMPEGIFKPEWGELKSILEAKLKNK